MNKNKRPQSPKSARTPEHQRAVHDLRSSSAAMPHRAGTDYRRKPKHVKKGWDD